MLPEIDLIDEFLHRLIYVKKSMDTTVVTAYTGRRSSIVILISQLIVLFNFICMVVEAKGKTGRDRSKFLVYQACVAPQSEYSVFFVEVMPINQFILYINNAIIVLGNWYLYRFLKKNTAKKESETFSINLLCCLT